MVTKPSTNNQVNAGAIPQSSVHPGKPPSRRPVGHLSLAGMRAVCPASRTQHSTGRSESRNLRRAICEAAAHLSMEVGLPAAAACFIHTSLGPSLRAQYRLDAELKRRRDSKHGCPSAEVRHSRCMYICMFSIFNMVYEYKYV